MSEVKTDLIKIETNTFIEDNHEYIITENHTLTDILRFVVKQEGSIEGVKYLLDTLDP